jgi:hypothetical protein
MAFRIVLVAHHLRCQGIGNFGDIRVPNAANRSLVAVVDFGHGPLWHAALAPHL